MTAEAVHEPPRPNTEATYRPLVSDDDWAQQVEVARAGEDVGYDLPFVTAKTRADRRLVEQGYGAWWGAFEGDRLLSSMGLFTASPGLARFQTVKTHPDARGRGLAGTLVHRVSRYGFEELGATTLVMVADPDYLAIRVYRSVGFADTERQLRSSVVRLRRRRRTTPDRLGVRGCWARRRRPCHRRTTPSRPRGRCARRRRPTRRQPAAGRRRSSGRAGRSTR